jgi:glycosyltransferase involved in cell wall biosynthesis
MKANKQPVRLLSVQYGDYLAAWQARQVHAPETYRAQYYSLDCYDQACRGGELLVVCLDSPEYDQKRGNVRMVGGSFAPRGKGLSYYLGVRALGKVLASLAEDFRPTHAVVRTPGPAMFLVGRWCLSRGVPVLPLFADYFDSSGIKSRLKLWPLTAMLNRPDIALAANHNYPACQSMVRAGVAPEKVVPYDWPEQRNPAGAPVKSLGGPPHTIVFAGQASRLKGLGDLLDACAALAGKGLDIRLEVFGDGPERASLGASPPASALGDRLRFHGTAANSAVLQAMFQSSLVVVPSRHEYPEGIPCVIYEAFETRTPAVLSDHPSFMPRISHGKGCLMFPASNSQALANALESVLADPELYRSLSVSTLEAWQAIQCPVSFGDLLMDWIRSTSEGVAPASLRWALNSGEAKT